MITGWTDPGLLRDLQAEGTDAHRLCTIEDGWVERFGSDVLISFKRVLARERLLKELQTWADSVGFQVRRVFARLIPTKSERRESPALVIGDPSESLQTVATEWYLRFGIDFGSNGADTLNIDLSKKYLARGRENFALNKLSTIDHRFITDDVRSVLPRLARRGEKFDAIILDPPTFSRSPEGKTFQVQDDFESLLISALAVAERDAHLLISTNCSALGERALKVMARYCLKETRRAAAFHRPLPLPDFPPRSGASSIWLALR